MPQLLIRDVPEDVRANIAASAAAAGRSMQAELLAVLQERYSCRQKPSLLDILLSASGGGNEEYEVVRDTPVRDFSLEGDK